MMTVTQGLVASGAGLLVVSTAAALTYEQPPPVNNKAHNENTNRLQGRRALFGSPVDMMSTSSPYGGGGNGQLHNVVTAHV
jgi:hypothetical protein